jgi:cysteine synthase
MMDVVALQEKISRIDGVEAARVVAGNGHIDEIHVLARRAKEAKQVVRDVQSLGQALFGITIDRRVVSVVQLADSVLNSGSRPALVDVAENIDGNRTEVTVTLKWKERLLVGQSTGAAAAATRWRLVAEATLEAVRQSVHNDLGLGVSSMDLPTLGSRKLAIAQVVIVTDASERMLIGSAYVDKDESRAVVRSVLDALNRLLPDLKTP